VELGSNLQNTLNYPNQNNYRLIYADYLVLDLKRQWFINDRGCSAWRNGQCHDPAFSQEFLKLVEKTKRGYDLVYENDGYTKWLMFYTFLFVFIYLVIYRRIIKFKIPKWLKV